MEEMREEVRAWGLARLVEEMEAWRGVQGWVLVVGMLGCLESVNWTATRDLE